MKFSVRDSLWLTAIVALVLGFGLVSKREARLRQLVYPQGYTYYSEKDPDEFMSPNDREFRVTMHLTEEEFAELYPDEWKFVVAAKIRETKSVGVRATEVGNVESIQYFNSNPASHREEQDDPVGAAKEAMVGDRIEWSTPAVTFCGAITEASKDGLKVEWLSQRNIFCDEKIVDPYPDAFIPMDVVIRQIETGWLDLLDY